MANEVEIGNLALAHLGDVANVQAISPPDGSIQAELVAKFYPNARDSLLEMHDWGFATSFETLAAVTNTSAAWGYAYALPNAVIKPIGLARVGSYDALFRETVLEEIEAFGRPAWWERLLSTSYSIGAGVLYANQADAALVFTRRVEDTTKFSPLFVRALSWLLASDLAGAILKGQAGATATVSCLKMAQSILGMAATSDANAASSPRAYSNPPWISGR